MEPRHEVWDGEANLYASKAKVQEGGDTWGVTSTGKSAYEGLLGAKDWLKMAQFGDTKSLFDADLLKPGQKLKSNYLKPTNCSIFEAFVPKIETEKLFWLLLLLLLFFLNPWILSWLRL